ncbi:hypothetical protein COI93_22055 [Bacillus cereus]|uniref:Uncharacterized protein n=1 Tax=Bacillus cereus TaxID=1396 RepID=A0A2B0LPQ9_BACCE|nr:hypothetical protein COI93_22055 [Bacillus cereus]
MFECRVFFSLFDKIESKAILLNYLGNLCGGRLPTYFRHGITCSVRNKLVSGMDGNKKNSLEQRPLIMNRNRGIIK